MSDDKTRVLTQEDLSRLAGGNGPASTDDGRTRVLSAAEADRIVTGPPTPQPEPAAVTSAAPRPAAPKRPTASPARDPAQPLREPLFEGGKIVFYCSNGHKITIDAAAAGKRGKCSKAGCGVPVVIPVPPGAAVAVPPVVEPEADSPAAPPEPPLLAAAEVEPPNAHPAAADAGPLDAPAEPASWDFVAGAAPDQGGSGPGLELEPPASAPGAWDDFDADTGDNPTARLLARLWLERDHGGVVELHLTGGSVLVPEWYEPRWSRGSHGLFASQAPDGTVTLTAVAWETIQKIIVRKVNGLPDGMF